MMLHHFWKNQPSFSFVKQYTSLSLAVQSTRLIRVNWGIMEELVHCNQPFIAICRREYLLFCWWISRKHLKYSVIQTLDTENLPIMEQDHILSWDGKPNSLHQIRTMCEQKLKQLQNFWISEELSKAENQEQSLFSEIIELAQKCGVIFLPVGLSIANQRCFTLSNGTIFPKPFSRVAVCVGNPIQVENVPVDQTCTQIEQALMHSEQMMHRLLQNEGTAIK